MCGVQVSTWGLWRLNSQVTRARILEADQSPVKFEGSGKGKNFKVTTT